MDPGLQQQVRSNSANSSDDYFAVVLTFDSFHGREELPYLAANWNDVRRDHGPVSRDDRTRRPPDDGGFVPERQTLLRYCASSSSLGNAATEYPRPGGRSLSGICQTVNRCLDYANAARLAPAEAGSARAAHQAHRGSRSRSRSGAPRALFASKSAATVGCGLPGVVVHGGVRFNPCSSAFKAQDLEDLPPEGYPWKGFIAFGARYQLAAHPGRGIFLSSYRSRVYSSQSTRHGSRPSVRHQLYVVVTTKGATRGEPTCGF